VVHRDLKAENVLFDEFMNIQLVDFGFSRGFLKLNPLMDTTCGSPLYMSPEIIREESYTAASDVWSAGVLLYLMVVGVFPFRGVSLTSLIQQIVSAAPQIPAHLSSGIRSLLLKLLNKNARARITVRSVLQDPWLIEAGDGFLQAHSSGMLPLLSVSDGPVLDSAVLAEMQGLGYDTIGLESEVKTEILNERTAVYKMIKKCKLKEAIARVHDSYATRHCVVEAHVKDSLPVLRIANPRLRKDPVRDSKRKLQKRVMSRSGVLPPVIPITGFMM
jgi:serine/threonine protein kinase